MNHEKGVGNLKLGHYFRLFPPFLVSEYMTCTSWRTAEEIQ